VQSLGAVPFDLVKFRAFSTLFILSSFSSRLRQRVSRGGSTGIKEQVLTRQRQLMRDPEVLPPEEAAATAKTLNGNGACRRGRPLGFPEQAVAAKMVVAVDVDEGIVKC